MLRGSIFMRQTHPQETFLVCGCKVRGFALIVQYLKIVVLFIWLNESVRFLLSIIIIHATTNLYNRQYHFISWMSKKICFSSYFARLIVPLKALCLTLGVHFKGTHARKNSNIIWFFARLIVPLYFDKDKNDKMPENTRHKI